MDETKTVEQHAKEQKTADWLFAAAKAYHRWAIGAEMTLDEYKAALAKVLAEPYGYGGAWSRTA